MKKFLKDLEKELKKLNMSKKDIEEILEDHKQMLEDATNEGLTDDQIVEKFGDPEKLAKDLLEETKGTEVNMEEYVAKNEANVIEGYSLFKVFEVDTLNEVEIKLVSEDVKIYPYDGDKLEVHYKKIKDLDIYDASLENGVFTLKRNSGKSLFSIRKESGKFIVRYPKTSKLESYNVNLVSGDLKAKGIDTRTLSLKTTSGDGVFEGLVSGETDINTVSGDFKIDNAHLGRAKLSAVSGDFVCKNVVINGNADLNTVSGDFEFFNSSAKEVDFRSVSGDLDAKEFYIERIDLKSVSGDVKIQNNDSSKPIVVGRKKTLSGDVKIG